MPLNKRVRNPEERKRAQKKYYLKTKESRREIRLVQTKEWVVKHPTYHKNWRQTNKDKMNAKTAKRRANKLKATPKWLSAAQLLEIKEFYTLAVDLSWLSLGGLHVDHIIPLQGKDVCGLHVPWNLQVIPKQQNQSKGNR